MTNNLRSENLMTQRLSEVEKQMSKQNKKNPLSIALPSLYNKGRPVAVPQDSILEMKDPAPSAKLIWHT